MLQILGIHYVSLSLSLSSSFACENVKNPLYRKLWCSDRGTDKAGAFHGVEAFYDSSFMEALSLSLPFLPTFAMCAVCLINRFVGCGFLFFCCETHLVTTHTVYGIVCPQKVYESMNPMDVAHCHSHPLFSVTPPKLIAFTQIPSLPKRCYYE